MGTIPPYEGASMISPDSLCKIGKANALIVEMEVWYIGEMNQWWQPPDGAFGGVLHVIENPVLLIKATDLLPDGQIDDLAAGAQPVARAGPRGRIRLDVKPREICLGH